METISLILPAYNEEKRIRQAIRALSVYIEKSKYLVEVLVVVEKSSDKTLEIAREEAKGFSKIKIVDNQIHRGKGFAVKSGMLLSSGDIAFYMDIDLATSLDEIHTFIEKFRADPELDILIGDRRHKEAQLVVRQNKFRQILGSIFNIFVQIFAISGVNDTQCGFKAFRRHCIQSIFSRQKCDGFAFDIEIIMIAQKLGFKFISMPVIWKNSFESSVRPFRDGWRMLVDLIRIRARLIGTSLGQRNGPLLEMAPANDKIANNTLSKYPKYITEVRR